MHPQFVAEDEQPQQTYYPSCKLTLGIRFDEFAAHVPPAPKKPATLRTGKNDEKDKLTVQEENGRLVLVAPGAGATSDASKNPPNQTVSSSDGRTWAIRGIVPRNLTLSFNGIRTASSMSFDIPFADFPFDPRLIRACAVSAYLGCVTPADFARGVHGEKMSNGDSKMLVPDSYVDANGQLRSNLRFQGWADDGETSFNDGDEPSVHFECTDSTRLLIDTGAPAKLTIDEKLPIDKGIADYLSNFPQFVGLSVQFRPAGTTAPIPKSALGKGAYNAKFGPPPSTGKTTVWDYLTDMCGILGLIVRFVGTTVVVQRPRTLYGAKFSGRDDDPFQGRTLSSGRQLYNRLYVYGRNIQDLSFKRKFATFSTKNVEVRCYSPKQSKTLVARYPVESKDRQNNPTTGDQTDQKWKVITVQGVEDEATLRAYAQGIYESIGRNELESSFSTRNLGSFGGGNLDPDMLDALPGDTISVEINRDRFGATIMSIEDRVASEAGSFLQQLGYPKDFADAYERAAKNVGFPTSFRVRKLTFEWSDGDDGGIQIHADVSNYIEVRSDKELPAGEETAAPNPATPSNSPSTAGT
jgi:hypothetical protein